MRHTRTANSVGVGDTVVDADDEPRTVIAITLVDRSMETEQLRVSYSDGSGTYHFADERVTVTDDPVPETFEVARWRPDRRIGPTMTPVNDLLPEPDFGDYTTVVNVIRVHLDAIGQFVDTYAGLDPDDTAPEHRRRLVEVEGPLNQALDRFS